MSPAELVSSAARGLMSNRLRSALTTLGIMIGVASVILLVAVGNGAATDVRERIEALGTNRLTVTASGGGGGGFGGGPAGSVTRGPSGEAAELTLEDAAALENPELAPDIDTASPVVAATGTATYADASSSVSQVIGSDDEYFVTTNSRVGQGDMFDSGDVEAHRRVVVVGQSVVDDLFGVSVEPVGEAISIDGTPFTVVGVLEPKAADGPVDSDSLVIVPITTARDRLTGYGSISQIAVRAADGESTDAAAAQALSILDQRHHVENTDSPFQVQDQASLLETSQETTRTFTVLLGTVAAISLLVGGIGITNIILVNVTERTREIGIRKAIGAPRRAILGQFLTEATGLSLFGGALGVVVALVGSRFEIAGIEPVIVPVSVLLAVVVSVAIGLFFGIFPANRAASLRPIEALRHD